jgi:hypothetical protein
VINLRGTTLNAVGWLENFYAAMVPARGELQVTKEYTFKYDLAANPKAAVAYRLASGHGLPGQGTSCRK